MTEITHLPAAALAGAIRAGRLTASDVVEAYLERIARVDPLVVAYVRVLQDRARSDARLRDAEVRAGHLRGPLHGVPLAVKDLMTIEGVPMTAGAPFLGREPSTETSTVVRRLEAAGAIVLGTTTLHQFAFGVTSVNPHGRTPRNPWRLDRVAGGSSGGSGAAVAASLAPAAVGTDTGGSIRIPSALCGIVGLKPTFGRTSRTGVLPLAGSFDTVGPMTRAIEDAALLLEVMAGHDPADPHSSSVPVPQYLEEMRHIPSRTHIGRLAGPPFETDLDRALVRALDEAARVLETAGFVVKPVSIPSAEDASKAQVTVLRAEAAAFHRSAFAGHEAEYAPDVRAMLDLGARTTQAELQDAQVVLSRVRAEVTDVLAEYPILLGPAIPGGAPRIADVDPNGERWMTIRTVVSRFMRLYNATGLPALVLPAALTDEGLPVALQLAAGPFAESLLLGVALRLEQAMGWSIPDLPRTAAE
jgi:aspartyl-tRNA(Asn)/glutamyl-tRNA(Gln) amidotransferase subunit A